MVFIVRGNKIAICFCLIKSIIFIPLDQGIGGKKKGALTDKAMKYLTQKYANAIYSGKTVEEMSKGIWATLKHCWSTDDARQHEDCPDGVTSWCFYRRAIAKGDINPFQHSKLLKTPLDKERLEKHLVPVYQRLTEPNLLARCLKKVTQNANESYHGVLWSRCSKKKFHGAKKVMFSLITAAADFNFGPAAAVEVDAAYGVDTSGCYSHSLREKRLKKRLSLATRAADEKNSQHFTKRQSAIRRAARIDKENAYGAGAAPLPSSGSDSD